MLRLFIGANNVSKQVEVEKALAVIASKVDGFTFYNASGYWKGQRENSLVVEIDGLGIKAGRTLAKVLCKKLNQQAVGLQLLPQSISFISL